MGTYTITTTDDQDKCLHYVLPDFQEWLRGAADGKINNCTKRFVRDWSVKLNEDSAVTSMPATESDFISTVLARSDYRDRGTRDAEEDAKQAALKEEERLKKEAAKAEADAKEAAEAEAKSLADAEALQAAIDAGVAKALAAQ